jgi:uroporphyrin-III C-methyltransferase/precorrin-2 dehydrogenase/sirohydrochlorin ferrochelatase
VTTTLFPLFLKLSGRTVVVVGGGKVAGSKLDALLRSGALVTVVSPEIRPEIERAGVTVVRRGFEASDLDTAWLAVAAATPEVNQQVAAAARWRRIFVNAVDDPENASSYTGGVLRRGSVTVAISTDGEAPALAGLLREAIDEVMPAEIDRWLDEARRQKRGWRRQRVAMPKRRPLLLQALNRLYAAKPRNPDPGRIRSGEKAR